MRFRLGSVRAKLTVLVALSVGGMTFPVAHTAELLDWAYGGPVPPGLEDLARFVTDVPTPPKRQLEDFLHP